MRILAIRGERLASLHDPFEVDFNAEPLIGAGLFAITGPTGAGKSTLLDAICLALYGDTPRVEGSGGPALSLGLGEGEEDQRLGAKDPRHLLSRGSKHGFAEVDFRGQDGLEYRARWLVPRRARAKGLADADMSVVRLSDKAVLASGPRDARREVLKLVGFTFAEFQKSVLLPQGEFAEFLRADAKSRADILEKVAGGEIYGELGRLAQDRRSKEKSTLERLEAQAALHQPLGDEARATHLAARDAANAIVKAAGEREQAARDAFTWHETHERLVKDAAEADSVRVEAEKASEEAGARRSELRQIEQALSYREVLAGASRAGFAQRAAGEDVAQKRRDSQAAAEASKTEEENALAARAVKDAVEAEGDCSRPQIEQAKLLDAELKALRDAEAEAERNAHAADQAAQVAQAEVAQADEICRGQARSHDEALGWLNAHADERPVLDEWTLWRDIVHRQGKALERAEAARRARDRAATPEAVANARTKATEASLEHEESRRIVEGAEAKNAAAQMALEKAEERRDKARGLWQRAKDAQGLSARRAELKEGEPCPLCGASDHPFAGRGDVDASVLAAAEAMDACELALKAAKAEATSEGEALKRALTAAARAKADAEGRAREAASLDEELKKAGQSAAEAELKSAVAEARDCEERLAIPFAVDAGWREQLRANRAAFLDRWEKRVAEHSLQKRALEDAEAALARSRPLLSGAVAKEKEKLAGARGAMETLGAARAETVRVSAARSRVLGGRAVAEVERALTERHFTAEEALQAASAALTEAKAQEAGALTSLTEAETRLKETSREASTTAALLSAVLLDLGIDRDLLAARVGRGDGFVSRERAALDELAGAVRDATTRVAERRRALEEHERQRPEPSREGAERTRQAARAEAATADRQRVAAEATLASDERARAALADLGPKLEAQRARSRVAAQLGDLIGSGGAKSFRSFAQGLALDTLLRHANRYLEELAPRYRLSRVPQTDMDLQVIDGDIGGVPRGVNSLSGGETFLVSLGLALGLSGLTTRAARVESLFIDEGFGTLDAETLEKAMDALERLRATGRTVGVISHVPELHERIGVLVEVEKIGAGRSRVRSRRLSDEPESRSA